ncbi:hypothetical protein pf16_179 [Pseudomonas phage pf16]|uniref:HigA2-like helix-turn-helix domain-containing protein n=1 Tax=Pseudomonas phage pf16 TaxID=1815630 RepID=A0A1S5R3V5_9CAUD|nr:HTH DNA binding protein [Pseudomonas phage pf16]AND75102.1 hypothetical protein pf16_179 [Pseudomonas phage pf16]
MTTPLNIDEFNQANLRMRVILMNALVAEINAWEYQQADSAKLLGITQPRMSDLMRMKVDKFSVDALINLIDKTEIQVSVTLVKPDYEATKQLADALDKTDEPENE